LEKSSVTEGETFTSEPKCEALGGVWTNGTPGTCSITGSGDFASQFVYSMNIGSGVNIDKAWDVRVSDINNLWIPIGKLDSGDTLDVDQNYYFDENAGNKYQGEYMNVTITFYAEQLDAPGPAYVAGSNGVVLDNKDALNDWAPVVGDQSWGILKWIMQLEIIELELGAFQSEIIIN
jgi:hypothetical protein